MTEQQADALMETIETRTKILDAQQKAGVSTLGCELELAALTALCRHRDQVVYGALFSKAWELDIVDLQNRIDEMQTWGIE